jgi:hypothetical protein
VDEVVHEKREESADHLKKKADGRISRENQNKGDKKRAYRNSDDDAAIGLRSLDEFSGDDFLRLSRGAVGPHHVPSEREAVDAIPSTHLCRPFNNDKRKTVRQKGKSSM